MKTYTYKITAFLLLFAVVVNAQTFDKKIEESFKVNSDVEIVVNTAHMDVDIETWNRNEVSVVAVMEVEGVDEKEAKKILKQWKFEALGNKNKVKISSAPDNMFFEFNHDFNFNFEDVDVDIPYFEMPEIEFPEMPEMPEMAIIEFPEMPEMPEMPEFEFDYQLYKSDSTYLKRYKMKVAEGVEKFKNSNWKKQLDSVRNSTNYKRQVEEIKKAAKEMAKEMKELHNSETYKQSLQEAKKAAEEARIYVLENRDQILEQVKVAKEANKIALAELKRMRETGKFDSLKNYSENIYFNYSTDKNSKIKIKKYLKIRVPKKATFNLNVRHGKVNIPESNKKMSANMSYSVFVGGVIIGSNNDLMFSNSPVEIETLNSSKITLKNVSNAEFGTFKNVDLFSNSSDVVINEIGTDVVLSQKFGNIEVKNIIPLFKNLSLNFDYTKATIPLSKIEANYSLNTNKSRLNIASENSDFLKNAFIKVLKKNESSIIGNFESGIKTENSIKLKANFSTINII